LHFRANIEKNIASTPLAFPSYGEFQNVFLSGEECTQLETAYPGKAVEYIERLSRYMASNDRHYANHYATIKKWLDEDSKGRSAKNYTYDDNEGECR
jgi:hypothetical protein